jgi:saccharopine dehydrogenase-like NADP-dependent oxidoreductase
MKNVLVLGAGGQITHWVIEMMLAEDKGVELTLYPRHKRKLRVRAPSNATVVESDHLPIPCR